MRRQKNAYISDINVIAKDKSGYFKRFPLFVFISYPKLY